MSFKDLIINRSEVLSEILVFKPSIFWDLRGNIYTSFNIENYKPHLPGKIEFVHDKFAQSKFNVLRGLHGDHKTWKLVSCVWGEIYEVLVDMRKDSPNYRKWDAYELSADNYRQILIPPGFVNGYYVKSPHAVFHYKLAYTGDYIDAGDQMTYSWDDPELNIDWPCTEPILQERDK